MAFDWSIFAELLWGINILTALCCMVYLLLVLYSSETSGDRGIIKTIIVYLFLFIVTFIGAVTYRGNPMFYVAITPGILFAMTTMPVLLYKMVCGLTDTEGHKSFSYLHFVFPVATTVAWTIATQFIPFDVRIDITRNFGRPAVDYMLLSGYFISISLHNVIFGLIYLPLSFARLLAYRQHSFHKEGTDYRYQLRWMNTVILLSAIITLMPVVMLFTGNRAVYFNRMSTVLTTIIHIASLFILTLNILRRNYPPRKANGNSRINRLALLPEPDAIVPAPEKKTENKPEESELPEKPAQSHTGSPVKFTKKQFEAFFRSQKPYLDPGLTLAGLAKKLDTNRSVLSGFINSTYGVNFNTFVNWWRLRELERLRKYKKYSERPLADVIKLAGFGSYDSYRRAKEANAGTPDNTGKEIWDER